MAEGLLATTFRFRVTLTSSGGQAPEQLGDGAFQDCTGLDMELEVAETPEGGRNNGMLQRAGRAKFSRLVLKRGLFYPVDGKVNTDLWQWFQDVVDGVRPLRRYDGRVDLLGAGQKVLATWKFTRGLPAKLVGPALNARTGDVAIEELQIAHEGLRMVTT